MDEKTLRGYRLSSYAKPYFFVDEQLAKLYGHGLDIEDYELAKATLGLSDKMCAFLGVST